MNIYEISGLQNEFEKFLDLYKRQVRDVVLFGGGQGAEWAMRLLAQYDIYPKKIVDKTGTGTKNGVEIIGYERLLEEFADRKLYIIISAPRYEEEILSKVRCDFTEEDIFCFECELYYSYIKDIGSYRVWLQENQSDLMKVYHKLSDELSRKTLENVLKGRISGKLQYFKDVYVNNQYFAEDIIKLGENETFCDVGAYTGDTVEQIVEITDGKYHQIYCFEPDVKCCEILHKNTRQYKEIYIIEKGAWNKKEILYIHEDAGHGASAVGEKGDYTIELDCVDDCIPETEKVSFIKMDIEGAELNALQGCKRIIKEYMPTLAICVYHKNEDFVNIPNYILSLVPEYKLYLRHHNISGTETVLYAIREA